MSDIVFNSSMTEASDIRSRRMHDALNHRQARIARAARRNVGPRDQPHGCPAPRRSVARWLALP